LYQVDSEDAAFLFLEQADNPAHLGLVALYDQSSPDGHVIRFQHILKHIQNRLSSAPVFHQKIKRVAVDLDYPYWIEDEKFDLEYHVRHLPAREPTTVDIVAQLITGNMLHSVKFSLQSLQNHRFVSRQLLKFGVRSFQRMTSERVAANEQLPRFSGTPGSARVFEGGFYDRELLDRFCAQVPGARLSGLTSVSPLYKGCGLMYSASQYGDQIAISFTSGREMLPDPDKLTACLDHTMNEINNLLTNSQSVDKRMAEQTITAEI
jgi:hypothetical protein